MIYQYKGATPKLHDSVFMAPGSFVIGDVEVGEDSSIWFGAIVRGDVNSIRIGSRTNIQDGSVLHVTNGKWPLQIGSNVTIGHGAILHGCVVASNCLIGMGAKVLDGARIGAFVLIAAGSLVREGEEIPEYSLIAGVPAVVKRSLTPEEVDHIKSSADNYVGYKMTYNDREYFRSLD